MATRARHCSATTSETSLRKLDGPTRLGIDLGVGRHPHSVGCSPPCCRNVRHSGQRARVSYACTRVPAPHLLHIRSLHTDGSAPAVLAGAGSPGSRSSISRNSKRAHLERRACTHVGHAILRVGSCLSHTHTHERTNKPSPRVHTVVSYDR